MLTRNHNFSISVSSFIDRKKIKVAGGLFSNDVKRISRIEVKKHFWDKNATKFCKLEDELFTNVINERSPKREKTKIKWKIIFFCFNLAKSVNEAQKTTSKYTNSEQWFKDSLVADIFLIIIWCATIARRTPTPSLTPTERNRWDKREITNLMAPSMTFFFFQCFYSILRLMHFQKSKLFGKSFFFHLIPFLDFFLLFGNTHVTRIPRVHHRH